MIRRWRAHCWWTRNGALIHTAPTCHIIQRSFSEERKGTLSMTKHVCLGESWGAAGSYYGCTMESPFLVSQGTLRTRHCTLVLGHWLIIQSIPPPYTEGSRVILSKHFQTLTFYDLFTALESQGWVSQVPQRYLCVSQGFVLSYLTGKDECTQHVVHGPAFWNREH